MMLLLFRWGLLMAFLFLVAVAGWAVITIRRMQQEQIIALTLLRTVAASLGAKPTQTGVRDA